MADVYYLKLFFLDLCVLKKTHKNKMLWFRMIGGGRGGGTICEHLKHHVVILRSFFLQRMKLDSK